MINSAARAFGMVYLTLHAHCGGSSKRLAPKDVNKKFLTPITHTCPQFFFNEQFDYKIINETYLSARYYNYINHRPDVA